MRGEAAQLGAFFVKFNSSKEKDDDDSKHVFNHPFR